MLDKSNSVNRYSDIELEEFKNHIEQKLASSMQQLNSLTERVDNISEVNGNDGDWMDDSSNAQDIGLLNSMINRQQKHIRDLENALIRIRNKRYGICVVTGELIDKRRLMAVPTTTKSLAAKTAVTLKPERQEVKKKKTTPSSTPTSFSRVIKRTGGTPKPIANEEIEDDELDFDENYDGTNNLDLDMIVGESSMED
ncbi:MAG: TraR/DksA family transcriptional regulator [Saprospiraceae bacterium]